MTIIVVVSPTIIEGYGDSDGFTIPASNSTEITTDQIIEISERQDISKSYVIKGGTLTLKLNDSIEKGTLFDCLAENLPMFYVCGGELVIGDGIILEGNSKVVKSIALIYLENGKITLGTTDGTGVTITDAVSKSKAGAISIMGGTATLNNTTIKNCKGEYGGAIRVEAGILSMNGGSVENCTVSGNGGAICVMKGTAAINKVTLDGNESQSARKSFGGGAIYATEDSNITICDSVISNNRASSSTNGGGAGILVVNGSVIIVERSEISYNEAMNGAGIRVESGASITVNDSKILNNKASSNGGGIAVMSGSHGDKVTTFIQNGGSISGNTADGIGNALHTWNSGIGKLDVKLTGGVVIENIEGCETAPISVQDVTEGVGSVTIEKIILMGETVNVPTISNTGSENNIIVDENYNTPQTIGNDIYLIEKKFSLITIVDGVEKKYEFSYGSTIEIDEPSKEGYKFTGWDIDVKEMPAEDITLVAIFEINNYKLTVEYLHLDGTTISEMYTEEIAYNKEYSVYSPIIKGYTADKTIISGTMGTNDITVIVIYYANVVHNPVIIKYSISAISSTGGNVNGTGTYVFGTVVTLTAIADEHYTFTGWYYNGDLVSSDRELTFIVSEDAEYYAQFITDTVTNENIKNGYNYIFIFLLIATMTMCITMLYVGRL